MAGSSQPQHFFAAGCLFADFAIAVIFYPVIKLNEIFACEILHYSTEQAILPKHQAASAKPISQILHRSPSRKRKKTEMYNEG